jgi:murein DD-endopeptidase MepM/ murein hydrolase activator NlpD
MKNLILAAVAATLAVPAAVHAADLEVRFCPAAQVRPYPLESRRDAQSLVLQNVAIVSHASAPVEVTEVDIDLMRGGEAIDTRRIIGPDLARQGRRGAGLQAAGMITQIPFQFCGDKLIAAGVKVAGPVLDPNQALLVFQQTLAYQGARDAVRIRVHGRAAGGAVADAEGAIPITPGFSKTAFRFPLSGTWFAGVGPTPHTGHRWALPEEFAFDIAKVGDGDTTHRGDGARFTDYFGYGAPVLAAADGKVVYAADGLAENPDTLRRPGESLEAYGARSGDIQSALLARGQAALAGNFVMIDHGGGEYSLYAHLQTGSVKVKVGDAVRSGQPVGKLGSSGNSTEPHLHFQVCDAPEPLNCAGIPINFQGISLPWADYARPVQSGDLVEAP